MKYSWVIVKGKIAITINEDDEWETDLPRKYVICPKRKIFVKEPTKTFMRLNNKSQPEITNLNTFCWNFTMDFWGRFFCFSVYERLLRCCVLGTYTLGVVDEPRNQFERQPNGRVSLAINKYVPHHTAHSHFPERFHLCKVRSSRDFSIFSSPLQPAFVIIGNTWTIRSMLQNIRARTDESYKIR